MSPSPTHCQRTRGDRLFLGLGHGPLFTPPGTPAPCAPCRPLSPPPASRQCWPGVGPAGHLQQHAPGQGSLLCPGLPRLAPRVPRPCMRWAALTSPCDVSVEFPPSLGEGGAGREVETWLSRASRTAWTAARVQELQVGLAARPFPPRPLLWRAGGQDRGGATPCFSPLLLRGWPDSAESQTPESTGDPQRGAETGLILRRLGWPEGDQVADCRPRASREETAGVTWSSSPTRPSPQGHRQGHLTPQVPPGAPPRRGPSIAQFKPRSQTFPDRPGVYT